MRRNEARELFQAALKDRDEGRPATATEKLLRLVQDGVIEREAKLVLGGIQLKQSLYEDAHETFAWLVKEEPKSEHSSLGLFQFRCGHSVAERRRSAKCSVSWRWRPRRSIKNFLRI